MGKDAALAFARSGAFFCSDVLFNSFVTPFFSLSGSSFSLYAFCIRNTENGKGYRLLCAREDLNVFKNCRVCYIRIFAVCLNSSWTRIPSQIQFKCSPIVRNPFGMISVL
jgi:hypothetical protein